MNWLFHHEWWRPLSVVCAAISLIGLALYWQAFPKLFPNKIGSIGVNVAI